MSPKKSVEQVFHLPILKQFRRLEASATDFCR
ncbi:MAG: hypothetical protein RLY70_4347 [Planctomycetota bacterium]|jgi:hypothetical protein